MCSNGPKDSMMVCASLHLTGEIPEGTIEPAGIQRSQDQILSSHIDTHIHRKEVHIRHHELILCSNGPKDSMMVCASLHLTGEIPEGTIEPAGIQRSQDQILSSHIGTQCTERSTYKRGTQSRKQP
jgi:hypothetical protein